MKKGANTRVFRKSSSELCFIQYGNEFWQRSFYLLDCWGNLDYAHFSVCVTYQAHVQSVVKAEAPKWIQINSTGKV